MEKKVKDRLYFRQRKVLKVTGAKESYKQKGQNMELSQCRVSVRICHMLLNHPVFSLAFKSTAKYKKKKKNKKSKTKLSRKLEEF